MAFDKIAVCNIALGHISAARIEDENEISNEAEAIEQFYDIALEATLAAADWKFASTFRSLTKKSDTTPRGGWSYAYQYPTKCVKMREILTDNQLASLGAFGFGNTLGAAYGPASSYSSTYTWDQAYAIGNRQGFGASENPEVLFEIGIDYDTEQKLVYTDVDSAVGRFTMLVSNVSLWSPEFVDGFGWALAAYIASPITRDLDRVKYCTVRANQSIATAAGISENETPQFIKAPLPDWIRQRGY